MKSKLITLNSWGATSHVTWFQVNSGKGEEYLWIMTQICTSSILLMDSWMILNLHNMFPWQQKTYLAFCFPPTVKKLFKMIFFGKSKITYSRSHAVTALTKINYPTHHSCFLMNAAILRDPKTTWKSLQIITIIIRLLYTSILVYTGFEEFQQLLENLLFPLNLSCVVPKFHSSELRMNPNADWIEFMMKGEYCTKFEYISG